jgi:ribosomal protein S6
LKLKLLGETLREVGVCEKIYLVGERSFAYIIKKHTTEYISPINQSALVQAA